MLQIKEFFNKLNKSKTYLILANIFLVFFLILFSNLGILPVKHLGDFIFFAVIFLLFAIYRPGWAFLFFIGTIALENINLAPQNLGLSIRPYQFIGGIAILTVLIRMLAKRNYFKLPRFSRMDLAPIVFVAAGFLSAFFAANRSVGFKQSIIILSFVAFYFLVRIFVQNLEDLKKIIPYFLSSSAIVILYGIWQNVRFLRGLSNFEAMPGRPNGTFAEPDWYGIYLSLLIAAIYILIFYFNRKQEDINRDAQISNFKFQISNFPYYLLLTACYTLLIITVSRSAWLGAAAVTFIFLLAALREFRWKQFFKLLLFLAIAMASSLFIIFIFHLTNFQLWSRVQSAGTGLQKITISCSLEASPPSEIGSVEELSKFGCRHINLEDIEKEKAAGNIVKEIYRPDPNVITRSLIYQKSWEQIKNHPLIGIGWGNIGGILGKDGSGTTLNSSNIFLEVWLGSGLLGLIAFILTLLNIFVRGVKKYFSEKNKVFSLFVVLGFLAIIVPNLLNAGIMLGFLWLFLALAVI